MPYFDRFDICEAYYLYFTDWHGGQNSREYQRLSKLLTYYRPSPFSGSYGTLTENGREIYDNLVAKWQQKPVKRQSSNTVTE